MAENIKDFIAVHQKQTLQKDDLMNLPRDDK